MSYSGTLNLPEQNNMIFVIVRVSMQAISNSELEEIALEAINKLSNVIDHI